MSKKTFTLNEMMECWEVAQDSFSKEIGGDVEELETDGYEVPVNKSAWFKERFGIDTNNLDE